MNDLEKKKITMNSKAERQYKMRVVLLLSIALITMCAAQMRNH